MDDEVPQFAICHLGLVRLGCMFSVPFYDAYLVWEFIVAAMAIPL